MLSKVCFEQEVSRRAPGNSFEGSRRTETLSADETQEIGLARGEKVEAFEYLKILPSQKKSKAQEDE
jgi:hypothetical protein